MHNALYTMFFLIILVPSISAAAIVLALVARHSHSSGMLSCQNHQATCVPLAPHGAEAFSTHAVWPVFGQRDIAATK